MRPRDVGVLAALVVTAVLLQVTVLPLIAGGGFAPDLVLVLVAVLALERGPRTALFVAGGGGLLADLSATLVPLGTSMLVLGSVAYLLGLLRPYLTERADLTTAVLAGAAGVVSVLGRAALVALLSTAPAPATTTILGTALVVGAFAMLLAPPVLILVRRVLPAVDPLTSEVRA